MNDGKCLIQLYDSDEIAFLGRNGQRVTDLREAMIFTVQCKADAQKPAAGRRKQECNVQAPR